MFRPRCPYHELVPGNRCDTDRPALEPITPEHAVRCHLEPAQRREIADERLFARGGNVAGGGADPDNPNSTRWTDTASTTTAHRRDLEPRGIEPRANDHAGGPEVTVVDENGAVQGVLAARTRCCASTEVQKYFPITGGGVLKRKVGDVRAVESISFDIVPGETLGIVGESGCGKSTAGRTMMKLLDPTGGKIEFDGRDITNLTRKEMVPLRREMQMIFQDPYSSLNPRHTVGSIISAPFKVQGVKPARGVQAEVQDLMARVGLNPEHYNRYPNEFSGGQRQRIGIARAIALRPKLIVCDEPVSALDVSIQAQVVNLLEDLQDEFRLAYVFIAHDLSVVRHISDRIAVMYLGRIMEIADAEQHLRRPAAPLHPRADLGGAAARPQRRARPGADPAQGRPAQPDQPAVGLRVPHPVPQGAGPVCRGDPAAARARARATTAPATSPRRSTSLGMLSAGRRWASARSQPLDLQAQLVLGDDVLRGHVRDAGQRQHVVRPPGLEQGRRQPQRVRHHHVVVGQSRGSAAAAGSAPARRPAGELRS